MTRLSARALLAAAFATSLAACPRGGDQIPPGNGSGTGAAKLDAGVAAAPDAAISGQALLPADGIACRPLGCVYHAGAAGYFACTSGGAGSCFHFGAACAPADGCMFDAGDGRYKSCTSIVEGTCSAWGAACAPASGCMYDARDSLHHSCAATTDGRCTSWGAVCDPG